MPKSIFILGVALIGLQSASGASAQDLSGAPQVYAAPPGYGYGADAPAPPPRHVHHTWREARGPREAERPQECYAQVHVAARYAPPATGPEYVWRQAPAPPGAPGPVWCLTVQSLPRQPILVSPERLGWIRVLCADQVTPDRVSAIQQRLYAQGLYRGGFDGRYDAGTAEAVGRFQRERHIDHGGYLSYQTWGAIAALPAPPPPPIYGRSTPFDTGVLSWPGKVGG